MCFVKNSRTHLISARLNFPQVTTDQMTLIFIDPSWDCFIAPASLKMESSPVQFIIVNQLVEFIKSSSLFHSKYMYLSL